MANNQYRKDNDMLHLEWETKFAAAYVTAELNIAKQSTK